MGVGAGGSAGMWQGLGVGGGNVPIVPSSCWSFPPLHPPQTSSPSNSSQCPQVPVPTVPRGTPPSDLTQAPVIPPCVPRTPFRTLHQSAQAPPQCPQPPSVTRPVPYHPLQCHQDPPATTAHGPQGCPSMSPGSPSPSAVSQEEIPVSPRCPQAVPPALQCPQDMPPPTCPASTGVPVLPLCGKHSLLNSRVGKLRHRAAIV